MLVPVEHNIHAILLPSCFIVFDVAIVGKKIGPKQIFLLKCCHYLTVMLYLAYTIRNQAHLSHNVTYLATVTTIILCSIGCICFIFTFYNL